MVIAEGFALITGIKTTIDNVQKLKSSYDAATIMEAQSDILEQLFAIRMDALTLQEHHLAIIHEKEELIKKLMQFEQWEKTKTKYELKEIRTGRFAYAPKESQQSEEPCHWLCTQCWEDGKKSILQETQSDYNTIDYVCPRCKLRLYV